MPPHPSAARLLHAAALRARARPLCRPTCAAGAWAPRSDARAVWHMLTSSLLNVMLVCMPLGIWAGWAGASPTLVFTAVRRRAGGLCVAWRGAADGGPGTWADGRVHDRRFCLST